MGLVILLLVLLFPAVVQRLSLHNQRASILSFGILLADILRRHLRLNLLVAILPLREIIPPRAQTIALLQGVVAMEVMREPARIMMPILV